MSKIVTIFFACVFLVFSHCEIFMPTEKTEFNVSKVSLEITSPLDSVVVDSSSSYRVTIKGSSSNILNQNPKGGIFVLIYPKDPDSGGWWIQYPQASINQDGSWFSTGYIGLDAEGRLPGSIHIIAIATAYFEKIEDFRSYKIESLNFLPNHKRSEIIEIIVLSH